MKTANKHVYPIIDIMLENATRELDEDGIKISCHKGCGHCCHLLIEISWEEALELAHWVLEKPTETRDFYIARIKANADEARQVFRSFKKGDRYAQPITDDRDIPEKIFDKYFYEKKRPCPFLIDDACSAYEVRPSPCRLHMVISEPHMCAHDFTEDLDVDVPDVIEQVGEDIADVFTAVNNDPRWGHFGIMVEAALNELQATS